MVTLNDFRRAVGMAIRADEAGSAKPKSTIIKLEGGDPVANVRMRQQLVEALSSRGLPKDYIFAVRLQLGLDTAEIDRIASQPLSKREIVEVIAGVESYEKAINSVGDAFVAKAQAVVEQSAKGQLSRSLEEVMADFQTQLAALGEECGKTQGDRQMKKVMSVFCKALQARADEAMAKAMNMIETAEPEDAQAVASAVRDTIRHLRELTALAEQARSDPSFDFDLTRIRWPKAPDFSAWEKCVANRAEARKNEAKRQAKAAAKPGKGAAAARVADIREDAEILMAKLRAIAGQPEKSQRVPRTGSTTDIALALFEDTMETLTLVRKEAERHEVEARVQGFRKRLSERMGFGADNVTIKV